MTLKELCSRATPDAEIFVMHDRSEDELAIEALDKSAVRIEGYPGQQRIIIDFRFLAYDIYRKDRH